MFCWIILAATVGHLSASLANNFEADRVAFQWRSEEIIHRVNNDPTATWKAATSEKFYTLEQARQMLGSFMENITEMNMRRPTISHEGKNEINGLPKEFDARITWRDCTMIGEIRDQSSCGSCWAFGAVEAMSDRICIHTKGTKKVRLSARDLLSCCRDCGHGCHGGYPSLAWDFWKNEGIVTGGSHEDQYGCQPYPFPSCAHHDSGAKPPCPEQLYRTPRCFHGCADGYTTDFQHDKHYAHSSYNVKATESDIQKEIKENGPVEASFIVYEDFLTYKSGIYKHITGEKLSGHAIKLLGWGVENKEKYWLAANSWNPDWGEKGFFRIRRGTNECEIESRVVAGMPMVH